LELGTHETITLTWVNEAKEMDAKHGHVERKRYEDEAKCSSGEMLEPKAL
jgi:hypothetical protein